MCRTRCRYRVSLAAALGLALTVVAASFAHSQTFAVLYSFKGGADGEAPLGALVRDKAGNIYGTTQLGGTVNNCRYFGTGCGVVFELDAEGSETILHRFTGSPDGAYPFAGVILDRSGNLYGTTYAGGDTSDSGTVFEIDSSFKETVLYRFDEYRKPPTGAFPTAALTIDRAGNLYGTTQEGGSDDSCLGNCGTVFKLDNSNAETVLLSFRPPSEYPTASVVRDAKGNLYGTTSGNGISSFGTVFKSNGLAPANILYRFSGGTDGGIPYGNLVLGERGHLYGTTFSGGDSACVNGFGHGCGIIFELNTTGEEVVLHRFAGAPDAASPMAGLVRDRQGTFYGTSWAGGSSDLGTIFKVDKTGKVTVLHSFTGPDGRAPYGGLLIDGAGILYGTTQYGGNSSCTPYGCGVVFKLTP